METIIQYIDFRKYIFTSKPVPGFYSDPFITYRVTDIMFCQPQFHRVSLKFFIEHFYTMSFMIAILVLLEMIKKLQDKTFLVIEFSNNKNKFYRLTNTINLINSRKSLITIRVLMQLQFARESAYWSRSSKSYPDFTVVQ